MVHKSFALSIGHAIGVSFISKEWFYKGAKKVLYLILIKYEFK